VLIVGEGKETEWNYFNGLRLQLHKDGRTRKKLSIRVKRGKGGSRQQIAQFAVDCKNNSDAEYDHVWCVMDVESLQELDEVRGALQMLHANSISPALSNPSFEVWLLAHFEKTGTVFLNCDAVVARLNGHWRGQFTADYDKADERIYPRLAPFTDKAIANAKWVRKEHHNYDCILECNSATDVYQLVGRLRGLPG
jgi:hypothetical protein